MFAVKVLRVYYDVDPVEIINKVYHFAAIKPIQSLLMIVCLEILQGSDSSQANESPQRLID